MQFINDKIYKFLSVFYLYYLGGSSTYFIAYESAIFALMLLFYFNTSVLLICFGFFDTLFLQYPTARIGQFVFIVLTFTLPFFLVLRKLFKKEIVVDCSEKLKESPSLAFYNYFVWIYTILSLVLFMIIAGLFSPKVRGG